MTERSNIHPLEEVTTGQDIDPGIPSQHHRGAIEQTQQGNTHLGSSVYSLCHADRSDEDSVSVSGLIMPHHDWKACEEIKRRRAAAADVALSAQRKVLKRLKAWHEWDFERRRSPLAFVMSVVGFPRRPKRPGLEELRALATFYFPRRAHLTLSVCDFGVDRFERFETTLGSINERMSDCIRAWPKLRCGAFLQFGATSRNG